MQHIEQHEVRQPAWIVTLVEEIVQPAITPLGFFGPIGYRIWDPSNPANTFGGWDIAVFPVPFEISGPGPNDGAYAVNGFVFDIAAVLHTLQEVSRVAWNNPTRYSGELDGPSVEIHAKFAGKQLRLRFFRMPPQDEPASHQVNTTTGGISVISLPEGA